MKPNLAILAVSFIPVIPSFFLCEICSIGVDRGTGGNSRQESKIGRTSKIEFNRETATKRHLWPPDAFMAQ